LTHAYGYLTFVMDAYAQGATPRLLQSYNNESGLLTTGFVYDNALAIIAFLVNPTSDNVRRAKVIGDSLLFAQATDRRADGRVRQAYFTGPIAGVTPGFVKGDVAAPASGFTGTATGDAAWVGLALAWLHASTGERRYLDGALALGEHIARVATSDYRYGGFLGGLGADGETPHQWASTEHNIDCHALFRALADLTGDTVWQERSSWALRFVTSMWAPCGRFFFTGTQNPGAGGDANEINANPVPLDAQTWSYLCLGEHRFSRAVDWAVTNLVTTDTAASGHSGLPADCLISGATFSDRSKSGPSSGHDRDAVWLEGSAQLALALLERDRRGRHGRGQGAGALSDRARALSLLGGVVSAQARLGATIDGRAPQTVGLTRRLGGVLTTDGTLDGIAGAPLPPRAGVVAASSALDTGFGFSYFPHQHVGATSWFVLAACGVNPFRIHPFRSHPFRSHPFRCRGTEGDGHAIR
jgi:hypothetical protein